MRNVIRKLKAFRRDFSGISTVEFALMAPVLLTMGAGGIEYINYTLAVQKAERVASTVADIIARNTLAPDEGTIRDTFLAVDRLAAPFEMRAEGRVIVTGVIGTTVAGVGVRNKVTWQRCTGSLTSSSSQIGTEWTATSNYGDGPITTLPNNIALLQNQMAVITETFYAYRPLINNSLITKSQLNDVIRQRAIFITRGQAFPLITPRSGVTAARCT